MSNHKNPRRPESYRRSEGRPGHRKPCGCWCVYCYPVDRMQAIRDADERKIVAAEETEEQAAWLVAVLRAFQELSSHEFLYGDMDEETESEMWNTGFLN